MCCIAPTHDQAWAEVEPLARRLGMDIADPAVREIAAGLIFIGGPDEVAEKLSEVLDSGVDGWTIACPANGQDPERVELLGQTASKLLALTGHLRPGGGFGEGVCYYRHRRNYRPSGARSPIPSHPHRSRLMAATDLGLDLGRYKLGWSDDGGLRLQAQEGPQRGHRQRDVLDEGRARLDARLPPQGAASTSSASRCPTGAATCRRSTSTTSTTTSSPPTIRSTSGTSCPTQIKETYEKLGIPEAERKYLAGVTAQYESEVVYHRNREDLEAPGRHLHRHGHRAARVPRAGASSTSARSSRRTTTSSPRSTRRCGRVARSSTCRRASTSRCRCRPTSASTPRTWASSSAR